MTFQKKNAIIFAGRNNGKKKNRHFHECLFLLPFFIAEREVIAMTNDDLRKMWKAKRIRQWEIAEKLGISDSYLSVKMRRELPEETKEKIVKIIEEM